MRTFKGGVHIPDNKKRTESIFIEQMPVVTDYYVSLSQHIGKPAEPVVQAGDTVAEGQLIAKASAFVSANIHSPVCGDIVGIEKMKNGAGAMVDCIHIKPNGKGETSFMQPLENPTPQEVLQRISDAGIVGMGGAGFPTAVKLQPKEKIDCLIINAVECEPYLNCDNRLLLEHTKEILRGIRYVAYALDAKDVYIGVEANKPEAFSALMAQDGVVDLKLPRAEGDIVAVQLKTKYPQGAEKTLIYACTKRKVSVGALPSTVGCTVLNVATIYAVQQAVELGIPLYKRVLTLSGGAISRPHNLEVRVGTSLQSMIDFCGGLTEETEKILMGGPMMGKALSNTDYCIGKTDSGFLALSDDEVSEMMPSACIHCGKCVSVCPMNLEPLYIDFYAKANDFDNAVKYGALNCFECGTCAYVCPAKRPLVQSVRLTKQKYKRG